MDARLDYDAVPPRNLILRSLCSADFGHLRPFLDLVPLVPRRILQHAKMPVDQLYFIEEGLVSVQAGTEGRDPIEVWLIGHEGVVGSTAFLGINSSPLRHVVQVGGHAYRIAVEDMKLLCQTMPRLQTTLHAYLHVALVQSAQAAACNLRHPFPQRLARWLLTAQDRSGRDEIPVTQDSLARALGVRRATVSDAMKALECEGVLERWRGGVRISDREGLEQLACPCYRVLRREQDRPLRFPVDRMPMLAFFSDLLCFI